MHEHIPMQKQNIKPCLVEPGFILFLNAVAPDQLASEVQMKPSDQDTHCFAL